MPRIKLILAYDGTDFHGWQFQNPAHRTVQAEVERAVGRIVGTRVPVQGAGRTDAGVHALGQVAHFDCPESLARVPWRIALNSLMDKDVRVVEASLADPRFHAQFQATGKVYAYTLWHDRTHVNPMRRRFVWDVPPLDLAAMDEAASLFIGAHDFASFRNEGNPVGPRGTVRTLTHLWREPGQTPVETVWRVRADGFLKQMVRNIVGCLVAVGKGKAPPSIVRSLIERRDRNHGLPTAPPWGLCMEKVYYGDEPEKGPNNAVRVSNGEHGGHPVDRGAEHPDGAGPERHG